MSEKTNKIRHLATTLLLLAGLAFVLKGQSGGQLQYWPTYLLTDYKAALNQLARQYQVNIIATLDDDFIDLAWRGNPANGKASPISDYELARFSKLLPRFFQSYPVAIIQNDLQAIKLSAALEFHGVSYGGTSHGATLYLTSTGHANGYTDEYIAQLFHHEFSSLLMRKYPFPVKQWTASNQPDFTYAKNTTEILRSIREDRDMTGNEALYKNGFLSKYAMSTLENDFNTYAETLFTDPMQLARLVKTYPKIKQKYQLLKRFYLGIDPGFLPVFELVK